MPYRGCLLVAAFIKIVSYLANSIFCSYTYADKTLYLFILVSIIYAQFRDVLARFLKMEAIFLVIIIWIKTL